jgi:hypothetical protein
MAIAHSTTIITGIAVIWASFLAGFAVLDLDKLSRIIEPRLAAR